MRKMHLTILAYLAIPWEHQVKSRENLKPKYLKTSAAQEKLVVVVHIFTFYGGSCELDLRGKVGIPIAPWLTQDEVK